MAWEYPNVEPPIYLRQFSPALYEQEARHVAGRFDEAMRLAEEAYYRCTKYSNPGHPRTRVTESELDKQMLTLFDRIKIQEDDVREWFKAVLVSQTRDAQADTAGKRAELQR